VTRRLLQNLVVAFIATATLVLIAVPMAHAAESGDEAGLVARTNAARGDAGRSGLRVAADLTDVARRQAARMAARGEQYHNPNLAAEGGNWQAIGENVGVSTDIDTLHQAFMDSPSHRANILDPQYTEIGVGAVRTSDGRLWVSEVFRLPMPPATPRAAAAPAAPATPAPATPAPAAAPPVAPVAPVAPVTTTTAAPQHDTAPPAHVDVELVSARSAANGHATPVAAASGAGIAPRAGLAGFLTVLAALAIAVVFAAQAATVRRFSLVSARGR
jgi:hypothetical protein